MKYIEFQKIFQNRPLIDVREVKNRLPNFDRRRFYEWQKKGYIKKLSKLFYIFPSQTMPEAHKNYIANKLVEPSYISLESALRYYDIIPEVVFMTTSITTRKTKMVETEIGSFRYRHVKDRYFFGYQIIDFKGTSFKIAEPEKAILDFLYLRSDIINKEDLLGLRINEDTFREVIDIEKLREYMVRFNSFSLRKKVEKLIKIFSN